MQYVFHKLSSIPMLASFVLIASLACAASKDARPTPGVEKIPPAGPSLAVAASQGVAVAASSRPSAPKTASSTSSSAGNDSAAKDPPITVPSVKGRTKKDSLALVKAVRAGLENRNWPVRTPLPLPGSILPARRIVAFYGNPLSKKMGILGELPPEQMLARLDKEIAEWQKADPATPVQPALHLIAVVAQGMPGRDGKYRLRMADTLVEKVASWAATRNALVFLDVQVGQSNLRDELPRLAGFLARPNFHLGIDPEFSMKDGTPPGKKIGTYDAADVNYASAFLADLVTKHALTPKVLVVHRFTQHGVTNTRKITLDPRVQVVMDM